jgi:hypothetical protein
VIEILKKIFRPEKKVMVDVYDFETCQVRRVPKYCLGADDVRIQMEGKIYWANRSQLKEGSLRHPPFEGERKQNIISIMNSLQEVWQMSYDEWEDGFRRDSHPDKEIVFWMRLADMYCEFSASKNGIEEKKEIFSLLTACSRSEKDIVLQQITLNKLSTTEAKEIIDYFYGN